jgi:hypothetical protein
MGADQAVFADGCARGGASGRPPRHQRLFMCSERLPLARLSRSLRPVHDVSPISGERTIRRHAENHALADAKPRLIAILLTGGESARLPSRRAPDLQSDTIEVDARRQAYDSAELREELNERGTRPVSQIATTGNNRLATQSVSTGCWRIECAFADSRTSGASQPLRQPDSHCLASVFSPPLLYGGFNESGPPTLADSFAAPLANSSSAIWASLRWRSKDQIDDGLAYRRQAWLRRRSVDSFFRPACARRRYWRNA